MLGKNKCDGGSQFLDNGDKVIMWASSQTKLIIGVGWLWTVECVDIKLARSLLYSQT